jgi:transcriptional regulator with XRE-family HTH domain
LKFDVVKELGERVRFCRHGARLTQMQLAERAGLPIVVIRRLEQKISAPSLERIVKIANALGVPLYLLFKPIGGSKEDGEDGVSEYAKNQEIDGIVRMLRQHGITEIRGVRTILREIFAIQRLRKS